MRFLHNCMDMGNKEQFAIKIMLECYNNIISKKPSSSSSN